MLRKKKIIKSSNLSFLNHKIDIPVGDQLSLLNLSYFVPIQIKNITRLDRKLNLINDNHKHGMFREIYKHIDQEYKAFRLSPSSWRRVLEVDFENEDEWFEYFSLDIFRGAQDYIILKMSFFTSELLKYEIWKELRRKFEGSETQYKKYKKMNSNIELQKKHLSDYLQNIESRGRNHVLNYFKDLMDFDENYHLPCIRLFSYKENKLTIKPNRNFWQNVGLYSHDTGTFESKNGQYLLVQNYKENTLSIFSNLNEIKNDNMYGDIENQIFDTIHFSALLYLGPGLVLSEIFNYLHLSFRKYEVEIEKKVSKNILIKYNHLIYLVDKFSIDIIDDPLLTHGKIDFLQKNIITGKLDTPYHTLLKEVILEKQSILLKIYKRERNYINTAVNLRLISNNYVLQIFVTTISLIALIVALLK